MVEEIRQEKRRERMRNMTRVEWLVPGVVWSVDGTEYCNPGVPQGAELLTVRDMCSKYLFRPMCTLWTPGGEEVGGHYANLFWHHRLPLFMKLDNGGNLKSKVAMDVIKENWVFPLVSPPEYPKYNGSIENAQGDIKDAIRQMLPFDRSVTELEFELCARVAAHDLNHQPRRILKGKTPCEVWSSGRNAANYTIQERSKIYDCVKETFGSILSEIKDPSKSDIARASRKAVEWWLEKNGVIRLTRNGKSVTLF
jgi:hypothetical protein